MYIIDKEKVLRFGVRKDGFRYIPVQIEDETEIKEGQMIFEAATYTVKEVIIFNNLDVVQQNEFIMKRTKCNFPMDNILPSILTSMNWIVMGLSVIQEEDEKLFM